MSEQPKDSSRSGTLLQQAVERIKAQLADAGLQEMDSYKLKDKQLQATFKSNHRLLDE